MPQRLPRLSTGDCWEPGRTLCSYLRAAQAYMLISMPTGTSTIFGVFQVIWVSQVMVQHSHRCERKTAACLMQGPVRLRVANRSIGANGATRALPAFVTPSRRAFHRRPDLLH